MTLDITIRSYVSLPSPPSGFKLGRPFPLTLEVDTTVAELISDVLRIPAGEVALAAVNGERTNDDYKLQSQDRVDLFPPIGGG